MNKEPQSNNVLPEFKRRKKKVFTKYDMQGISYKTLLELHIKSCKLKNLENVTIDGYRYASRYFLDFTGYDLLCMDITQDLINEYCLFLQTKLKPQTVNSYMFKISPTIRFGMEKGYITHKIEFTHLVKQETIKDIYSQEELEKLLKRPTNNSFTDFRVWVIINLFLSTGIRATEFRELKIKDVKLSDGYITLNKTKNNECRLLPMPTTLITILKEWLQVRNATQDEYLFCNIYGEKLQRTVLQSLVKRYSLKRGVNKYGLHLYRHTFITLSIRNGMSPIMLKRITGHKTMKMLERYYSFNPIDLVNIIDEYNPLEQFKAKNKIY